MTNVNKNCYSCHSNKNIMKNLLYLLVIATLCASCKKSKDDDPAPSNNNTSSTSLTVNSTAQVKFNSNGTATQVLAGVLNGQTRSGFNAIPPDSSLAVYGSYFETFPGGVTEFEIDLGYIKFVGDTLSGTLFKNFMANGSRAYVNDPETAKGVVIYRSINGVLWATNFGTGIQTGSTFNIIDKQVTYDASTYVTYCKTLITFNCTLYDGNGNSITLTNGEFVGKFGNI